MNSDPYLDRTATYMRLKKEYELYGSLVIAFDLDSTVHDYHQKGDIYPRVIQLLKDLKSIGCYLICFTANDDREKVATILKSNDIPFNGINQNPPFFNLVAGKIYYNALLCDRAGLWQVYEDLNRLYNEIKEVHHEH